jgi:hypothetical protein
VNKHDTSTEPQPSTRCSCRRAGRARRGGVPGGAAVGLIRAYDNQFLSWPAARAAWPCPAGICNILAQDIIRVRRETQR